MFAVFSLLLLGLCYGSPDTAKRNAGWRIVGGSEARPGQFPYFVSLQDGGHHMCGGALLDANTVLTAAHCFKFNTEPETWSIVVGAPDLSGFPKVPDQLRYQVSRIHIHHMYKNGKIGTGDIAVVKTKRAVITNDEVQFIKAADDKTPLKTGTACTVMGYGYTEPHRWEHADTLLTTPLKVKSNAACQKIYKREKVTEENICAGSNTWQGVCNGDSGGPLVCDSGSGKILFGVTSYTRTPCGQWNSPSVFTSASYYHSWIWPKMNRPSLADLLG